jgi:Flp pilus assembly protein protease CpaA
MAFGWDWMQTVTALVLGIATLTDLRTRIIPNRLLAAGFVLMAAIHGTLQPEKVGEYLLVAAAVLAGFMIMASVAKGAVGGGDIKLFALLGFGLGLETTWRIIVFSHVLAGVVMLLLWLVGRLKKGALVPFAPYIFAGFLFATWPISVRDWFSFSVFVLFG